ncbi:MAG: hydroxymethylbilane synthase [Polyangiaceae bacterium]|nr:hydroxymethylbilane synthase [Polyangiaceae bacterium]
MKLVLCTRKSALALAQSRAFASKLKAAHPGLEIEELQVTTSGDKFAQERLQDIGGKGLFVKELEEALYDKRADFAVHSIKDVPAELAPGLELACIPEREDPRDVLVSRGDKSLADLPQGARVGTSSMRRALALREARPDLAIEALRGNVDTRLRKVDEGALDAIVLALAGLKRLGRADRASEILEVGVSLPAVGQGALGIECRADDDRVKGALAALIHRETSICVAAERAFMAAVGGSCRLPVAAHAKRDGSNMTIAAFVADADGSRVRRGERLAPYPADEAAAAALGSALGRELA